MPHSVHDALFKSTFSDPRHAEGALRAALPAQLSARFTWPTLALEPGSFVDKELQDRHTDLLFSVLLGGRPAFLYLLYEHQSTQDWLMPFRLITYSVRIWEQWLTQSSKDARRLPAIVPVVLHHGEKGWTCARSLEQLYDLDEETLAALGEHILRLRFVLDDVSEETDDALRARAMSALGRLVLYCLRHAREPKELVRGLGAWVGVARDVLLAPNGVAALQSVWRHVLLVHKDKPEVVLKRLVAVTEEGRVRETMRTAGEELIHRGELRGEKRGELRALRRTLLTQLTARFGPLPDWATLRIDGADTATLDALTTRVLTAPSLEEALKG